MDFESMIEQLEYENYLAEKAMLDELMRYQTQLLSPVLTETAEIVLQEAMKDTILKYIRKITANTQGVWNKFKQGLLDKGAEKYYENNKKYLENSDYVMKPPKDFELPQLDEYWKFIANTNVPPYNAATMDDHLDSVDEFLKHILNTYRTELDSKSLKQIAEEKVFKKATGEENIGIIKIKEIVNFAAVEYKKITDRLSVNLKNINTSNRSMESLLKMSQSVNGVKQESYTLSYTMNQYFSEDGDGTAENNNPSEPKPNESQNAEDQNTKFRDADSNPTNDKEKEKQKKLDGIAKIYFKSATLVISQQLAISNKTVVSCLRMMKEYVKGQQKKEKISDKERQKEHEKQSVEEDKEDLTPTQIQL